MMRAVMILGAVLVVYTAHAEDIDLNHEIILNLTIITPPGQPDRAKSVPMKTLDECWEAAKAWTQAADIGKKDKSDVGLGAGCGIVKRPSQEP